MKLVDTKEIREIDKLAMEGYGMPGILLMDQAAKAVADVVIRQIERLGAKNAKVVVLCGKGNNGGDGLGAARYLKNAGYEPSVFLIGAARTALKGDAALEAGLLEKSGITIQSVIETVDTLEMEILKASVIVDAMLGTGFSGELKGIIKKTCSLVNSMAKPVVAVDIPTGIDADLGLRAEDAIWADITVTMALPKVGLFLYPGKENIGELVVADIGMPKCLLEEYPSGKYYLNKTMVADKLPLRRGNAHKGDAGRVAVVAGSPGFIGAAAMSSWAAVKTGAGLVSLLTPETCSNSLSIKLTEVMVHGIKDGAQGELTSAAEEEILSWAAKMDAVAIGPGLGTSKATQEIILRVLAKIQTPVIIDADALTALTGHTELLPQMHVLKILTPHPGEMARLTGLDIQTVDRERVKVASHYAKEWQAIVVLKGAPTIVALPDGSIYLNPTGCAAMATGGSGDVLTGILVALLASGIRGADAALAGVFLHGLAGEIACKGEVGLAASEIADALVVARQQIDNKEDLQISIYNNALIMIK